MAGGHGRVDANADAHAHAQTRIADLDLRTQISVANRGRMAPVKMRPHSSPTKNPNLWDLGLRGLDWDLGIRFGELFWEVLVYARSEVGDVQLRTLNSQTPSRRPYAVWASGFRV